MDDQTKCQWTSAFHHSLLQHLSSWWFLSGFPEECDRHPILKKANLDAHVPGNYRPISNLSYLSKLLERCVNTQLNEYLSANNLLPSVQSAYRKFHSTESAVLKVLSDIYSAADEKMVTLLGLLDLSAAFDTVDHQILYDRLWVWTGWFRAKLVQILSNQPNNLCSLQWPDIRNHLHSLRRASGICTWSNHLHSLRGRSHQHSWQTRICCLFLRRRPPDLRPLASIFHRESGNANVELCRGDRRMDGQQPTQAQPVEDGTDLARIFSAAEALPGLGSSHCRSVHQGVYARPRPWCHDWEWSVAAGSHQPRYTNLLLPSASNASRPPFSHDRHGSLPRSSSCA